MHSFIGRRHSVSLVTFLALAAILGSPAASATTQLHFLACPTWTSAGSGYFSSPQEAAFSFFQSSSQIPTQCKPLKTACTADVGGPIHYTCTGTNAGCPTPYTTNIWTNGTGPPVAGNNILYAANTDGKTWCAYWADDPHHPKDRGDPYCPTCDNPKGNPVNVATGNKFQSEDRMSGTSRAA